MKKHNVIYTVLSVCLALCLLLSACGAAGGNTQTPAETQTPGQQSGSEAQTTEPETQSGDKEGSDKPEGGQVPSSPVKADTLLRASSYEELSQLLASLRTPPDSPYYGNGSKSDDAVAEEAEGEPQASAPADNGSYSGTNVQVDGVDEADIVKTDGRYIYTLTGTELVIGSANGDGTYTSLSHTTVLETNDDDYSYYSEETGDFEYSYSSESFSGMYISGTTAALISSYWSYHEYGGIDRYESENDNRTNVRFYDVSDPYSPALIAECSQDGTCLDSRMSGGTLYLISSYYQYNGQEEDIYNCVPCVYKDDERSFIAVGDIGILPVDNPSVCCVVCSYDLGSADLTASEAVYGSGSYVYMNDEMLCLACCSSDLTESEPRTESVYTVVDRSYESTTHIVGFPVSGGSLGAPVYGSVPGFIESQFSMDIYGGYLRMVTTVSKNSYSVYTDSEFGFENYIWGDPVPTTNALWILDGDMNVTGSIEGLAEEERIYSARFDGDICYFVTFRSVDPLFAADLSDPTSPKILSELKIPGFSEYLHKYGEGRLFGLGYAVSDVTNRTTGLKLSMFDISDPADVTEKHTLAIDESYSPALYNHKAILVAPEKDIIGFPTESGYAIYGYNDEDGFYQRALSGQISDWWGGDMRGLWIGDWFYIVDRYSQTVNVMSLTELEFTQTADL